MSAVMAQWVRDALAHWGESQTELALRLTSRLGRSFDKAAVNKMALVRPKARQKRRRVQADEMFAISEITGFPVPTEGISITHVPLISWVSAGRLADTGEEIPIADVPLLAFADLGKGDFFALKVQGDSMDRVSPEGSVIVVDRSDQQLVVGKFFVFSIRGEPAYKRWRADPPHFAPFSTNPSNEPIFVGKRKDFQVVGRVRRTFLDL